MARESKIERILVPLDGSGLAEAVLPLTAGLAESIGATLILLHIVEQRAPQTRHGEPHLTTAAEAESYLTRISERFAGSVRTEMHVHGTEENNVAQSIAAHVDELHADMVALCTHGRSDIQRLVWGSIAQLVLRRVRVPVLIVRPQVPARSKLESILVMLDTIHEADHALSLARQIARACNLPMKLISVVPTAETLKGDRLASARLTPISTAAALDVEQEQAASYLEKKAQELRAEGFQVEELLRRGEVTPALAGAADVKGDALLVVTTHGRAGIDAALAGSVGQAIISKTSQPVLLIKIPQE